MATKKIAANLDLLTNQLQNFAIENVSTSKLPEPTSTPAGRIVFNTTAHALQFSDGSQWVTIAVGESASEAIEALTLSLDGNKIKLSNGKELDLSSILGFTTVKAGNATINSAKQKTLTFSGGNGIVANADANGNISYSLGSFSFVNENGKMYLKAGAINLASFDTSEFVKDGMLKTVLGPHTATVNGKWTAQVPDGANAKIVDFGTVTKDHTYIGFVWDTNVNDTGDAFTAMALDVTTLVNIYSAGDGLELDDNGKFSIKIADNSDYNEGYLYLDENGLAISGVNSKITNAVDAAKLDMDKSLARLQTTVEENATGVLNLRNDLTDAQSDITGLKADVELNSKKYDTILGGSSDASDANTIYGIRKYATNVARLMGGFNFTKEVTSGTSVDLFAGTTVGATKNSSSYMVDLESISVRTNTGEQIEVEVKKTTDAETPVMLAWSGITPTSSSPLIMNYRVILAQTGE